MKPKITAYIEEEAGGLWMVVKNDTETVTWAIEKEEVLAIRDACDEWLARAENYGKIK